MKQDPVKKTGHWQSLEFKKNRK